MSSPELWSIIASIVSVILGGLAIGLSVYFFVQGRTTERDVSNSLTKIEAQAESLQRLTSRYMDRLTRYVTAERPDAMSESVPMLMTILSQLPQTLTATLMQASPGGRSQELQTEVYSCYIALYFYIAQTNYWSQFYLPRASDFSEENEFHVLVRRTVDMSCADFGLIASVLEKCDQSRLQANPQAHLLNEAKGFWRGRVRSTAQIFVSQEHAAE